MISMRWPVREGLLLLGGVLFAFFAWVPLVINVLPRLVGRHPGQWQWGLEHLPEFFGSHGADHAIASWFVALIPYLLVQLGRVVNRAVRIFRRKGDARHVIAKMPDQLGS